MDKGVSVIICCYNSSGRLPETLRHLANQKFNAEFGKEIILVNNNSTDETVRTAQSGWRKLGSPFLLTVVDEPEPGLSFARARGVERAGYAYLVFCDDDNWLSDDYLDKVYSQFETLPEQAGMIGGSGKAVFENERLGRNSPAPATGPQSSMEGDITEREAFVYGAGMAVKKEVFDTMSSYRLKFLLTDRIGKVMSSGGDAEICMLAVILGYRIYYYSGLEFRHFMPDQRLTPEAALKGVIGVANSKFILNLYGIIIRSRRSLWILLVYPFIEMITSFKLLGRKEGFGSYSLAESRLIGKTRLRNLLMSFVSYYLEVPYFLKLRRIARINSPFIKHK